jgi:hypothetical protein
MFMRYWKQLFARTAELPLPVAAWATDSLLLNSGTMGTVEAKAAMVAAPLKKLRLLTPEKFA